MSASRVLVVTPSYRRYGPAVASWLHALSYASRVIPGVRIDWLYQHGNPPGMSGADGHDIVTAKYREAQDIFLEGTWQAFISIEDDMVIPPATFPRLLHLLALGADIGYGLYVWRHGYPRWSAYVEVEQERGVSLSQHPDIAREAWGNIRSVAGVGLGCTIIAREVLERLEFRRDGQACCDWYLALDAQRAGYVQHCDLGLVCGHFTVTPSPRILWPDPDDDDMFRIEYCAPPDENEQRRYAAWVVQRDAAGLPVPDKPQWLGAVLGA